MTQTRNHAQFEDEESYFVSMTDVLIGLLFVFIIMLMFFATRLQQATQTQIEENKRQIEENDKRSRVTEDLKNVTERQNALIDDLSDSETARSAILTQLEMDLKRDGITVFVLKDDGILRLPEDVLFEKASWEVKSRGFSALKSLAKALDHVLPCYTSGARSSPSNCPPTKAKIEAIFIEGHADADQFRAGPLPVAGAQIPTPSQPKDARSSWHFPFGPSSPTPSQANPGAPAPRSNLPPRDNLDLSTLRATSTFREILKVDQNLMLYHSPTGTPILSVSGYGDSRPLQRSPGETNEQYKQRNRRIDLRILMATVRSEEAKRMQSEIERLGRPQ